MKPLLQHHLPAAGRGDDAFNFLHRGVLAMRAVWQQVNVMQGFVFGGVRHVADFNAAQVLDPAHTLCARHDQAQRVAVFRAQHFTVLAVGHQHLAAGDQAHGDGARHAGAVGTFSQYKLGSF